MEDLLASLNESLQQLTGPWLVLGAAGLAVGLALKNSLSNFSSGVMLVFFCPFEVGEREVHLFQEAAAHG